VSNAFAVPRLLPRSKREKDLAILALRHQPTARNDNLEPPGPDSSQRIARFCPPCSHRYHATRCGACG
jgi:hypothetical protein